MQLKIITIRLSGGLGNQMFQYAVGRNLSIKNKNLLKLDITPFTKNIRVYSLDKFNISGQIASEEDILNIGIPSILDTNIFGKVKRKIFRMTEYFKPLYKRRFVLEPRFHFCQDILKIKNSCYLSGDWQSEKYFKDIGDIIRKEFTLKNKPTEKTKNLINKTKICDSVSIHIRRGDYISSQKTNQFHGVCSPEYYKKAQKTIENQIKNPIYFIFSDDIGWVKNNFKTKNYAIFVSGNDIPDYEEIIVMSKCKHNIIANSSFSWWGAWLNENRNKIVIAPKKWFKVQGVNTNDLIPESWITI